MDDPSKGFQNVMYIKIKDINSVRCSIHCITQRYTHMGISLGHPHDSTYISDGIFVTENQSFGLIIFVCVCVSVKSS